MSLTPQFAKLTHSDGTEIEIWNQARTSTYLANGVGRSRAQIGCAAAPELADIIGLAYDNPVDDAVWWFDNTSIQDRVLTGRIAGFMPLSVSGLDEAPYSRRTYDTIGNGAALGRLRVGARIVEVVGLIIAADCCSATAYLRALGHALANIGGSCDGPSCSGGTLDLLDCIPESSRLCSETDFWSNDVLYFCEGECVDRTYLHTDAIAAAIPVGGTFTGGMTLGFDSTGIYVEGCPILGNNDAGGLVYQYQTATGFEAAILEWEFGKTRDCNAFAAQWRTLTNVALVEGPEDTGGIKGNGCDCGGCGAVREIRFTLVAGDPCLYLSTEPCLDLSEDEWPEPQCRLVEVWGGCCETVEVEREVARTPCPISVRHDGTWCPIGWTIDPLNFPPDDCYLTVAEVVEYGGVNFRAAEQGCDDSKCAITLSYFGDGLFDWTAIDWEPDGSMPCGCEVVISSLAHPPDGIPSNANPPEVDFEVTNVGSQAVCREVLLDFSGGVTGLGGSWEPQWDIELTGFPEQGATYVIIDQCDEPEVEPAEPCIVPSNCSITLSPNQTWSPENFSHDPTAEFPSPGCTISISEEYAQADDTTTVIETMEQCCVEDSCVLPKTGSCGRPVIPLGLREEAKPCVPTCAPYISHRLCCRYDDVSPNRNFVPYVYIDAGTLPVEQIVITAYEDPDGLSTNPFNDEIDSSVFDSCEQCWTFSVPVVEAGAQYELDGRTQKITYTCPDGQTADGQSITYGSSTKSFKFPTFSKPMVFCIDVSARVDGSGTQVAGAPRNFELSLAQCEI